MDLRWKISRITALLCFRILRLFGSGATALPGLIALKLDPEFITKALKGKTVITVTGTNGKTTTSNLIANILKQAGINFAANHSGSNLLRGIASTLIETYTADVFVLESDEAEFSAIVEHTRPRYCVFLNLFRDQIDRYGEVDATSQRWEKMLPTVPPETTFIINADDPSLAWFGMQKKTNVIYFGINDTTIGSSKLSYTADAVLAPEQKEKLVYETIFYSHLGIYKDKAGKFSRPELDYAVTDVQFISLEATSYKVQKKNKETIIIQSPLPGTFNLYNGTAAIALASEFGIKEEAISKATSLYRPAFGRLERIKLSEKKELILLLVKNPVSFDQAISLIARGEEQNSVLVAINDNIADGRDISWLWDVNFEGLAKHSSSLTATGTRAHDMALRMKYAGLPVSKLVVINDLTQAIEQFMEKAPGEKLFCLLTYTAMLNIHRTLAQKGLVQPFYKKKQQT